MIVPVRGGHYSRARSTLLFVLLANINDHVYNNVYKTHAAAISAMSRNFRFDHFLRFEM